MGPYASRFSHRRSHLCRSESTRRVCHLHSHVCQAHSHFRLARLNSIPHSWHLSFHRSKLHFLIDISRRALGVDARGCRTSFCGWLPRGSCSADCRRLSGVQSAVQQLVVDLCGLPSIRCHHTGWTCTSCGAERRPALAVLACALRPGSTFTSRAYTASGGCVLYPNPNLPDCFWRPRPLP